MNVAELVATLGLNVDEQAFQRAGQLMVGLGKGLMGIGALAAGAFVGLGELARSTGEAAAHTEDLANRLGVTTQALQELEYAGKMSGIDSFETLTNGLGFLSRNIAEARDGNEQLVESFKKLGVDPSKMRSTEEALEAVAARFPSIKSQSDKTKIAMDLFGRSGRDLIPLLNEGADGLAKLRARAHELGIVMTDETIKAGAKMDDSLDELGFAMRGLKFAIGAPLIGAFTRLTKATTEIVLAFQKWARVNLKAWVDGVGNAAGFLADHLNALKFALYSATAAFVLFRLATSEMDLQAIGFAVALLARQIYEVGLAAVVSGGKAMLAWLPFLLLGAAIVLIFDEVITYLRGGDSLLGRMIAWFNKTDPSDSPFMKAFRAFGSLIFDITDPQKWDRAADAVGYFAAKAATALMHMLPDWLQEFLKLGATKIGDMLTGGGVSAYQDLARDLFPGGAASPRASAAVGARGGSTDNSSRAATQTNHITINAGPGADGAEIGNKVADTLDSHWHGKMSHALAAAD